MTIVPLAAIEPERWVLVFQRESKSWWVRLLAWGRYKHVAAYAYLPGFKAWLIYDVNMVRTSILVVPDAEILGWLEPMVENSDCVAIKRGTGVHRFGRLGMWCVPAVAHLIGLRTGALRPDRLFRDCLRAGGEVLAH